MRGKAVGFIALKHPVGERILFRHREIRSGFAFRREVKHSVFLLLVRQAGIESIHLAAIVVALEAGVVVIQIVWGGQRNRRELDGLSGVIQTGFGNVGARNALKQVVGRAVFLHQDNDVLNR
jgi:hypothetical protein